MQAVVLAAGQGTRLRPLTDTRPKPLVPVAGRPIVEHVLDAAATWVDEFVLVVGFQQAAIESHLGDAYRGVPITYRSQESQSGTADAVAQAEGIVDDRFLVLNGDVVVEPAIIEQLAEGDGHGVAATRVAHPEEYGVFSVSDGYLTGLVEKPESPPTNLANMGMYAFEPSIFGAIDAIERSDRGEFEITDAIESLLDDGADIRVSEHDGYWLDVGYPWDVLEATQTILGEQTRRIEGSVHPDAELSGAVVVEAGASVRSGTTIEGPALVKSGAEVGPNAYVRGATVIGEDCHVGHAVEIKNSVLFEATNVPHLSYVGDSVLGANVNLGAGTNVANLRHDGDSVRALVKGEPRDTGRRKFGVVCGDNVKTGINTSLNPGVKLPTNHRTRPGAVVFEDPGETT